MQLSKKSLFGVILFLLIFTAVFGSEGDNNTVYMAAGKSWLSLRGTTNINTFECTSSNLTSNGFVVVADNKPERKVDFSNAELQLNISTFDCRNPMIKRDMINAMGGDKNSSIGIRISDSQPIDLSGNKTGNNFLSKVEVTINGITASKIMEIQWIGVPDGPEYHFRGRAGFSMSDFDIEPPSAALGLIRVNDNLTIDFNYVVQPVSLSDHNQ